MNYGKDEPYSNYEPHKEYESKKLKKQKFYEDNFYKILTGDDDDDNRPPSRDRNNLRDAIFNSYKDNIPDENDNIILKYLLLTITPNYTNYSMNTFAQKMRLINAMLNRKLYG